MYLKTSKVNQNNKESVAAKEYWKLEDSHPTIYKQPAHYTDVILQFINLSFAKKILEFGCGSGRNLNQLNDFFEKQTVEENFYLLRGIDINQHLIEYGKTNFSKNLELIIGDENSIKKEKNNFYDLIFTVSVLDHLPDPSVTIQELIKKTKRYIIFIEPFNSDIKKTEKIENISTIWKKQSTDKATPYTYFHNYKSYFKQNKLDIVLELPLPTHLGKIGPFYKLFLVQKINNKTHVFDKNFLIEQLQITAILTNIRNSSSYLAKLNKSVQTIDDLNQQIKDLNQQIKTKDEKIDQLNSRNSKFSELIKTELSNTYNNKLGELFLKGTKSISAFMKLPYEIYKFRNNIKQKIPKILGDKTFDLFIKKFCSQSIEEISKFLDGLNISNKIKSDAYIALSRYFRNKKDFNKYVQFADLAYKTDPTLYRRKFLMFAHAKNQDYQNFKFLFLTFGKDTNFTEEEKKILSTLQDTDKKIYFENILSNKNTEFGITKKNKFRMVYVLHNSLPYSNGGYSTRSHSLSLALQDNGLEVICITRPGYPLDTINNESIEFSDHRIEEVLYQRIGEPLRNFGNYYYFRNSIDIFTDKFVKLKPDFVMAASFHFSALPAIIAAKKLNIPTIYEVRGFSDLLRNSKNKNSSMEKKYIRDLNLERRTAKIADHVITLNKYMKEKLIYDGIESNKISIITNGCDFRKFKPQAKDLTIIKKLAINSKTIIIGYVGSLAFYEGIDDLVKVCGKLKKDKIDFKLLIVGSSVSHKLNGEDVAVTKIKQIAKENKIDEKLITTGRISSDEILKYYSLIDIMVYPRKALPICEIVLPTKVLESIALGKAIIVSSVNGLSEMITNNKTGLVFEKSNMNSLYLCLRKFLIDKKLRFHLGNNARQHNEKIRNWNLISLELIKIIKNISKYSSNYNYRKSKEINEIKIATQDKLVKKNINLNLFENYPEWWNFITDDFKQKSEYIDINSWNLSKSCLVLKNKYTNKFGHDRVGRRIPLKNWIRADIFSEIVKPNLELQDIGSGLGEFLNLLSLKNKKIEIDSIDLKDWDLWFDFDKRFNRYYKNIFDLDLNNKREITTCFEVIEHLPTHQIQNAVEILRGITKKKLFISVPFLEKLPLYKGHFTRFDEKKIIQLFPDGEYRIISKNPSIKKYVDAWILIEININ